jgi:hypothetical protein
MATTSCPTRILRESPTFALRRMGASIRNSAKSVSGSSPISWALKSPESGVDTVIFSPPWTTWLFVKMKPSGVKMNPDPLPPRLCLFSTCMRTTEGLTDSATVVTTREYASIASASVAPTDGACASGPGKEIKEGLLLINALDKASRKKDSEPPLLARHGLLSIQNPDVETRQCCVSKSIRNHASPRQPA